MEKLLIEWGKLDRTESLEQEVLRRAKKVLKINPKATKLVVTFQIINPKTSKGVSKQKVSMELRMPNRQDIRVSREGANAYALISDCEKALLRSDKNMRTSNKPLSFIEEVLTDDLMSDSKVS